MWFLWGLLMWFGCHYALNMFLSFSTKYKNSRDGMDLYVAVGFGVACLGATIFAFSYIDKEIALLIGGAIGFLTGVLHFNANVKSGELQRVISQSNRTKDDDLKEKVEALNTIFSKGMFSHLNLVDNDNDKNTFEINKVYQLADLEKRMNTSTGYAQHIGMFGLMLEGLKEGAEDFILSEQAMGVLDGKQKPILEILYSSMQQNAQEKYGEKQIEKTPIEHIRFTDSPKTATITFINPKVNESRALTLAKVKVGEIWMGSLFRFTETLDAVIVIRKNKTFTVTSYKNSSNN